VHDAADGLGLSERHRDVVTAILFLTEFPTLEEELEVLEVHIGTAGGEGLHHFGHLFARRGFHAVDSRANEGPHAIFAQRPAVMLIEEGKCLAQFSMLFLCDRVDISRWHGGQTRPRRDPFQYHDDILDTPGSGPPLIKVVIGDQQIILEGKRWAPVGMANKKGVRELNTRKYCTLYALVEMELLRVVELWDSLSASKGIEFPRSRSLLVAAVCQIDIFLNLDLLFLL